MITLGVDNGLKGGIAVITADDTYVVPMPVIKAAKGRNIYDEVAIRDFFKQYYRADGIVHAFVEKSQPFPKNGPAAIHTSGTQYGMIRMACVAYDISYDLIPPREWQKAMFAGMGGKDTKANSIIIAKRLFPTVSLKPNDKCSKDSDGMSDSLLIAEYGRRKLNGAAS